jgi:hypothetical protein
LDLIEKRGSFYSYKDERLAQGRENVKQVLRENPALCFEIENAIRRETGLSELDLAPAFGVDGAAGSAAAEPAETESAGVELLTTES